MAFLKLSGAGYMVDKKVKECTGDIHRWDKWQEPMHFHGRLDNGIEQNMLLQYRQCADCGKAEVRRVV